MLVFLDHFVDTFLTFFLYIQEHYEFHTSFGFILAKDFRKSIEGHQDETANFLNMGQRLKTYWQQNYHQEYADNSQDYRYDSCFFGTLLELIWGRVLDIFEAVDNRTESILDQEEQLLLNIVDVRLQILLL